MSYMFTRSPKNNRKSVGRVSQEDTPLKKKNLPNSLLNRIMQDQQAEDEADRLSQ